MLEGRSIYIWRLSKVLGAAGVDAALQKAKDHKLSSLWVKIADGDARFQNVNPPWGAKLTELVTKAHTDPLSDADPAALAATVAGLITMVAAARSGNAQRPA